MLNRSFSSQGFNPKKIDLISVVSSETACDSANQSLGVTLFFGCADGEVELDEYRRYL